MKKLPLAGACVVIVVLVVWIIRLSQADSNTAPDTEKVAKPVSAAAVRQSLETSPEAQAATVFLQAEIRQLKADLLALQQQNQRLNEANASLQQALANYEAEIEALNSEVIYTYGSLDESARFFGSALHGLWYLRNWEKFKGDLDFHEKLERAKVAVLSIGPLLEELKGMEGDPAQFASYQSQAIAALLDMEEPEMRNMEQFIMEGRTVLLEVDQLSAEPEEVVQFIENKLPVERMTAEESAKYQAFLTDIAANGIAADKLAGLKVLIKHYYSKHAEQDFKSMLNEEQAELYEGVFQSSGVLDVYNIDD